MAQGKEQHKERLKRLNSFGKELARRCKSSCELCEENTSLQIYEVTPVPADPDIRHCLMICNTCREQIDGQSKLNVNHWHCLHNTMWTDVEAAQVLIWRQLKKLSGEPWAQDLLEQMFLEESVLQWAENESGKSSVKVVDSNGTQLEEGDSVYVIKDLEVKGAGFTAKRGTIVKNIHLCDDPDLIEGKVNKTRIFLKTCFLKKA